MKTVTPANGMVITEDTRFESGVFYLPEGISIGADNITLDGNGAQLVGWNHQNTGVRVEGLQKITVKNLQVSGYQFGLKALNCQELNIKHCRIFDTGLISLSSERNSTWVPLEKINGCGILLAGVRDGLIKNNNLQGQTGGLSAYSCRSLTVDGNNASHNAGYGFFLFDTASSKFTNNLADHCSRSFPKPASVSGSETHSAGFALMNSSSNNQFVGNSARFCSIGFLLEGLSPDNDHLPCSDNSFERNEATHCKVSAFSDGHNRQNIFIGNNAGQSGYGFLAKNVTQDEFRENTILGNQRAGIGAENSIHCDIVSNTIQDNRFGVLLWSAPEDSPQQNFPENDTSKFWHLESNTIHQNGTGIRIAGNQEAGLVPHKPFTGKSYSQTLKPHDHEILQNVISENRVGIQTVETERTIIKDNHFELNLQGDIKS